MLKTQNKFLVGLMIISFLFFVYSFIGHANTPAWMLFSLPAVLLWIGLIVTHRYFEFSKVVYLIAFLHIIVMLTGAKYTYSTNPLFDELASILNLGRNYFDRVGHYFQGLTPAIIAFELLRYRSKLKSDWFFYFMIICTSMGISALYELSEYLATVVSGYPQAYVLGLQGDIWDTQNDMLMALIGSLSGIFIKLITLKMKTTVQR